MAKASRDLQLRMGTAAVSQKRKESRSLRPLAFGFRQVASVGANLGQCSSMIENAGKKSVAIHRKAMLLERASHEGFLNAERQLS